MRPDGVIGDNAVGEGVLNNLATEKKKNKRTKTDKTRGAGGNEQHVTDGGNGGVDICNNKEADGIVDEIGTADNHSVNDITVSVVPELKKEIVLVSKDALRKMIKMLINEDMLDNSPVNPLCNLIPIKDYLLEVAANLDDKMIYVDDAMHTMTITGLVHRTFDCLTEDVEGNMECNSKGEIWVDIFRVWQLIHALYENSDALGNLLPPSAEVDPFYNQLKPIFEKAIASVKRSKKSQIQFLQDIGEENERDKGSVAPQRQ